AKQVTPCSIAVTDGRASLGPDKKPHPPAKRRTHAGGLMDRIVIAVATEITLVFGAGIIAGVIAMVALAIRKEDKLRSLTGQPPSAATRGARRLNGVGLRDITPWEMPR